MIKTDYHLHTDLSIDSKADMEEMILSALSKNLKEIIFTDHKDRATETKESYNKKVYLEYLEKFEKLKEKYKNKIDIRLGVEIGMSNLYKDEINDFISRYPFEFVIGSLHDIGKSQLYTGEFFNGMTKKEAYKTYFDSLYKAIKVSDIDVVGHFDYIPRYVNFEDISLDYIDYKEEIDEILYYLVKNNIGLEINTSGYQYKVGYHHPKVEILKAYKKLGGEIITIGSDAHRPEDVGRYFNEAKDMLLEAGFTYYTRFKNREPYREYF